MSGPVADADASDRVESRGVVLVASASTLFADVVGCLVEESGFTPAFPVGREAPWLSVTRTQPRVVIFDYDAPVKRYRRLIAEVSTRRVPLLMAYAAETHGSSVALTRIERVTWQRFPASAAELLRVLGKLVPPDSDRGVPHQEKPSDSERQYWLENTETVDNPE